jgi:hypothetical protein
VAHPQIAIFDRLSKGGEPPNRLIFGQPTNLSRTMHDIRYNSKRDEILVTNPFAQAVLIFAGGSNGQAAPVRIIQGPKTELGAIDALGVDSFNDEIYIPDGPNVKVFPGGANGDVAPVRMIQGGNDVGWRPSRGIAIDYVHDVVITDGGVVAAGGGGGGGGRNALFIMPRESNGKTKPARTIRGDRTGLRAIRQIDVYPKNGWILVAQLTDAGDPIPPDTFLGVWSIYDDGNVPPRWKIDNRPSNILTKPRGVTYNPNHKEVLISDMRLNAVLTFAFPEVFDIEAKPPR